MRQERAKQEEEELKRQKEEENKPLGHYEHNLEINKKIALIQACGAHTITYSSSIGRHNYSRNRCHSQCS
jgi:hypothetical protein